ncbi:MAG: serine hydrolase [Chitinophagaceae bacterium]|nr:serine hydrolase [Chitinophagaceae bacterium]
MKHFLLATSAIILLFSVNAQTGIPVPSMVQTDNLIKGFLSTYEIPGASVAIAKDGKIVYMRAFGYADINKTTPTQPYNVFRIASLSKQVTSIAIMKLMQEGLLTMSSKVFGSGGILENHPVFSSANITDNRIYNITIRNLMEHSAGWNREIDCNPNPSTPYPNFLRGCDAVDFPLRVTQVTATSNPVTKDALIKFILEKGLNFAPGTDYKYSNLGFLILGEVIEKITNQSYEKYVRNSILAPLGIFDMHIGNNLLSEKQEREGEYTAYGEKTLSCYGTGESVPREYGGYNVTAMDSHGGWIASSRDMLKLLTAVDGFNTKPDILEKASIDTMVKPSVNNQNYAKGWNVNTANNWWHTGGLDGTACEQVRTAGGYTWIIILNKRNTIYPNNFGSDLDNLGWNCLAATATWPTWDLMESPTVNALHISFTNVSHNAVTINWTNGNGNKRMLLMKQDAKVDEFPLDGTDYVADEDFGASSIIGTGTHVVYNGTGNSVTVTGLKPGATYFFRTVEITNNAVTGNNSLYLLGGNPEASQTLISVLPINLRLFDAVKLAGQKTRLTWETASELNGDYFMVERSSNANSFTSVGKINATNTNLPSAYTFIDEKPFSGKNYYRLKEVDKNGSHVFSKIILVDYNRSGNLFTIVPVPGKNQFNIIKPTSQTFINAVLTLRNASGQTVLKHSLLNQTMQTISTSSIAGGIYFATIYNGKEVSTNKVVLP